MKKIWATAGLSAIALGALGMALPSLAASSQTTSNTEVTIAPARGACLGAAIHTPEEREKIQAAVLSGDYNTWKSLVEVDGQIPERFSGITADNFAKFSEMHKLMDQARTIGDELGLKGPGKHMGPGMGRGQHRGQAPASPTATTQN